MIKHLDEAIATFPLSQTAYTTTKLTSDPNSNFNTRHTIRRIEPAYGRGPSVKIKDRNNQIDDASNGFQASVSPNPFCDQLSVAINLASENESAALHLYDLQGRLMLSQTTTGATQMQTLNTASLAPGMYFLRVESGGEYKTIKVVKTQ